MPTQGGRRMADGDCFNDDRSEGRAWGRVDWRRKRAQVPWLDDPLSDSKHVDVNRRNDKQKGRKTRC